jgi:hypothetical protein
MYTKAVIISLILIWWYYCGLKGGGIVEGNVFPCFQTERLQDFLLLV